MGKLGRACALFSAAALSAALLAGCSDPVDTVKGGTLDAISKTVKVGDALERYSGCEPKTQKWASLEGEDKQKIVRFTCTLKGTEAYYKAYRDEIEQARAGIAFLQSMAEAFNNILGRQAGPDLNRQLEQAIAAVSVTRNDIEVDFAIDSKDEKKFSLAGVTTDFYWGGDSAQAENDPVESLRVVYENKPFIETLVDDRKEFTELLGKLYAGRTVAESGKAASQAASKGVSSPAASEPEGSSPAASASASAGAFAKF